MSSLAEQLTPETLKSIRDFWFQDLTPDSQRIVPSMQNVMKWFSQSDEFDAACTQKFKPILSTIQTLKPTASDLISTINPSTPQDWISLILLLDQFPRNIYRGPSSSVVFTLFDPLALSVALAALSQGVDKDEAVRFRLGERVWFYLPLTHAEDMGMQDRCVTEYEGIGNFVKGLDEATIGALEAKQDCRAEVVRDARVLLEKKDEEATGKFLGGYLGSAVQHREVIARFGRYPHRNEPLGREPTAEEKKYLEEGGATFTSKKADS